MKASEFQAVTEAKRAAENQLAFFNKMMAAKNAASASGTPERDSGQKKQAAAATNK